MRTYVISGSASGIGRATADLLKEQGHTVIGVDLHDADVMVDLTTDVGRERMVTDVSDLSGGAIDAIAANAGLSSNTVAALAVNYYGAIATLDGLRPLVADSDAPRAVVTASMASLHPPHSELLSTVLEGSEEEALSLAATLDSADGYATYPTSKQAIARWVRKAAPTADWAGASIPLNAIAPGVVHTAMTDGLFATEEGRKQMAAQVPMPPNGPADAEVCAEVLSFLTSPVNSHLCGQGSSTVAPTR